MEWRIDTSVSGEVKAANLRKTLEASRDHWLKTQAEAQGIAVQQAAMGNVGKPGEAGGGTVNLGDVAAKAADAVNAHRAKSATLAEQMQAGIDAACALADKIGGIVTATIVGHDDERHPSRVARRVSVHVDQTWQ
jgi:hypothetical protein